MCRASRPAALLCDLTLVGEALLASLARGDEHTYARPAAAAARIDFAIKLCLTGCRRRRRRVEPDACDLPVVWAPQTAWLLDGASARPPPTADGGFAGL